VNRSIGTQTWRGIAALGVAAIAMFLLAVPAGAAVYPAGGSSFSGSTEGWRTAEDPACNIPLGGLCSATGGHDDGAGNPPGSLAATTNILLNLGGLFKSTVVFESPNFTASEGGAAALHVERELASENVLDLTPSATYAVKLVDRTTGSSSELLTDSVAGSAPGFTGKDAAATLVAGHIYAISIATETSSSVANIGLMGSTALRFDNVALSNGPSGGGNGNGDGSSGEKGGNGASGLSDSRLLSLLRASDGGTAVLKGKRLFVKAPCPAKVGRSCRLSIQGLLGKRKPATTKRTSKVAKGKAKTLALKVKPKAKAKLVKRDRLLFKQTVRAGGAKATIYKRLKLIRR
jgi:hypothetical protein